MVNRIIGVIGWIGTLLVFGAVAVRVLSALGVAFLEPEWTQYAQWAAYAGLVCVLIYMAGQWRDVRSFYARRQARYGTISIVSIVVFVAILVALNYLGVRRNKRWDLTANQVYSLSDQTVRILKDLDAPLKMTVYSRASDFDQVRDRLDEYAYQTDKLTVE